RTEMIGVCHLFQTICMYRSANWAPTFLLKQGKSMRQSLTYGFLMALVSPVGPLIAVLTTERLERKRAIVILSLLMASTGLAFPFASSATAIVVIGGVLTEIGRASCRAGV